MEDELLSDDTGWLFGDNVPDVFGTFAAFWTDQGSRIRKIGNRVRFEVKVLREGASLGPGNFTDSAVHAISDTTFRPDTDGEPLFVVGAGSGGTVAFRLDEDGTLYAVSSTVLLSTGDTQRVVVEWLTD